MPSKDELEMELEWIEMKQKYGREEAIYVCADLWGKSTFQVEQLIRTWNGK